jgi:hypothetical protein
MPISVGFPSSWLQRIGQDVRVNGLAGEAWLLAQRRDYMVGEPNHGSLVG